MLQLNRLSHMVKRELKETFVPKTTVSIIIGTAITTFGLYNVHQQADITEGGILGLILLLNFWLGMSSSLLSPVLDFLSYLMGFKYLGKEFLKTSIFATLCMADFSVYGSFFLRSSPAWQISLLPLQSWEAVLSESAAAL